MANLQNPVKAIRAKCLDCCGQQANEAKMCPAQDCPLYPFRFGKNPYRKRELTPEQKAVMGARLAAIRQRKHEEAQYE